MWIAFATCQIIFAGISFVASTIITIMVGKSTRLGNGMRRNASSLRSSPYHRIVFGLSISDMLQSFALILGPFSAPEYVPQALWGAGNDFTCRINGFMFYNMGSTNTPLYIFFLCYYFLCRIKRHMTDNTFSQKIEWKLHAFIITFNCIACIAALATNTLHSNVMGTFCASTAGVPTGCRANPENFGECDESIASHTVISIFASYRMAICVFCLVGIFMCMVKICWYALVTRDTVYRGLRRSDQNTGSFTNLRRSKRTSQSTAPKNSANVIGFFRGGVVLRVAMASLLGRRVTVNLRV